MQTNGAVTEILSELHGRSKYHWPISSTFSRRRYLHTRDPQSATRDRIALRKQAVLVYRADLSVLDEQTYRWADGFMPMEGSYLGEGEVMASKLLNDWTNGSIFSNMKSLLAQRLQALQSFTIGPTQ